MVGGECMQNLRAWLSSIGISITDIIPDNAIHRFDYGEKKDKSGWYIASSSLLPSGQTRYSMTVGDNRTGEKHTFKPNGELSIGDKKFYAEKKNEDEKAYRIKKEQSQEETAIEAEKIWGNAGPASKSNGYIVRKSLTSFEGRLEGIREAAQILLVPVRDIDDKLWGIEFIHEDGTKRFLKGTRKQECFFRIGEFSEGATILVAEGYATGKSLHMATGLPTVVAFDAGNLLPVSRKIRGRFPTARIVLCADNDQFKEKNVGLEKATVAAEDVKGLVCYPRFKHSIESNSYSDWNDLHCSEGLEEVKRQVLEALGSGSVPSDNKPFPYIEIWEGTHPPPIKKENRFPVEALGPLMGKATQIIAEKVSAPVEIVCSSMLAAAAICVQPFYNIKAFGSIRPISLYFITIAKSGERKSTVDKIVLKEHYKWREEKDKIYIDEKTKYRQRLEEWKEAQYKKDGAVKVTRPVAPKAPVLFVSEPTVEGLFFCLKHHRDSVGLFSDEGGSFLGGFAMKPENAKSTVAKLNQLWDGSPIDRIRRGKDEGEIDILYNKRVSMHLMAQPKIAFELFNNEYAKSQGFLARCLTSHAPSDMGGRKFLYEIKPPPEMEEFYQRVRMFLERKVDEPRVLGVSTKALQCIEEFYYEVEGHLKEGGKFSGITDFASKAVEHCIRMAAVLETFHDEDCMEIDSGAMERAISIIPFFLNSQIKNTESASVFPSKDAELIYEWISKREEWKVRDLLRTVPIRYRKKEVLMRVIGELTGVGFCSLDAEHNIVKIGATK